MRRRKTRARIGPTFDLFGQVPVTWPDVVAWCVAVAGLRADSPRLGYYARFWNVPDKVRAAKIAGTFDADISPPSANGPARLARLFDSACRARHQRHDVYNAFPS